MVIYVLSRPGAGQDKHIDNITKEYVMFTQSFKTTVAPFGLAIALVIASAVPSMAAVDMNALNQTLTDYDDHVSARVNGDTVYLTGQVGTEEEKSDIISHVARVPGVHDVEENIENIGGGQS